MSSSTTSPTKQTQATETILPTPTSTINTTQTKEQKLATIRLQKTHLRTLEQQRQSLLPAGSLYILLYLRDPPSDNNYHWALYHHTLPNGGYKHHISNLGSSGRTWIGEHDAIRDAFRANFLVVAIRIGVIPEERWGEFERIVRSLDGEELNLIEGMNCRVWVVRVLRLLKGVGLVWYGDDGDEFENGDGVNDVVSEIFDYGNQNRGSAVLAELPRPIVVSKMCR